jgi:hypothetical protein
MKNIATALVKAQQAFGPALKSSTNPHFRSRYADLSACVEAVIEGLNGAGIALVQRTSEDTTGVTVETVFIHESGEMLECGKLHVPAAKQDPQGYGSALTYARRYDGNAATRKAVSTPDITDHLAAIEASANSEELAKVYKDALAACDGNQALQAKVIAAKKARVERAKQEKS